MIEIPVWLFYGMLFALWVGLAYLLYLTRRIHKSKVLVNDNPKCKTNKNTNDG